MASATSYASSIVYGAMVRKVCSRSQGQPRCGSRKRAMMSSRRSIEEDMAALLVQQPVQRDQQARRRAPDVGLAVRNVIHTYLGRAERALARLVIGRIEDVQQRHFESRIDLAAIERERKARLHEADDRRHPEPAQH